MNYIQEINAFYDWLETNSLPKSAIALWHALMHINNKAKWANSFEVAISTIEFKTGFKRSELFDARNLLSQKGRITWRTRGGNLAATYTIVPFCVHNTDTTMDASADTKGYASGYANPTQMGTINKLNNTKQNETSLPVSPVGEPEVPASKIIDLYNQICKNLPAVKILTEKRRKAINARLREHGYEKVIQMLENASKSNFLAGQSQRGFIADLDWLFKPENFAKALEGKYDDDRYKSVSQGTVTNGKDSNVSYLEGAYERLTQQP